MAVFGMLRVRNEEKYLERCLYSILPVCNRIFVMDDNSTDRTAEIIQSFDKCSYLASPFAPDDLDEARDKTLLLKHITNHVPNDEIRPGSRHWVFQIDGDEELVEADRGKFTSQHLGHVLDHWNVQILYLWDSPNAVRWDGHYAACYRPSIFRLIRPDMEYRNHSGRLHPTGVPVTHISCEPRLHEPEPIRLLHYGYLEPEERERKYKWYVARDPVQSPFYRKECFGPATLTPLSTVLR